MENEDLDALADLRRHFRSVSFTPATEFISIDLKIEPEPTERSKDKAVRDSEILLAGILVEEACKGGNGDFQTSPRELQLYKIYNKPFLRYTVYLFVWLNLSLALFEEPAVPALALPYWATLILEYFCLFVFTLRLFHVWSFAAGVKFWKDKKHMIVMFMIVLTFLDMIMYVIFREAVGLHAHAKRWTRVLRPLYLVNISEGRQIRRAIRNIRRTLPEIANVLVLLLLLIALFSLLGVKLFGKRGLKDVHGKPYFSNYFDVYFSLYVLTTTANNPDVGMPAYDDNAWSTLFFVVFLVICMYIFVSIFLAVVYKNYRKHLKNEVRKAVFRKRRQLKQAFDVLKIKHNDKWQLTEETFMELMNEVRPKWSKAKLALFWQILDDNEEGMIGRENFLMLADLLNVEVLEVSDQVHLLERLMPRIYLSWVSNKIKQMVCHRFFMYFFDLVIFVNAIFISLDTTDLEIAFLALFNLEILLKFYTFGLKDFFRSFWNWFDFLVIGIATVALIVDTAYTSLQTSQTALDFLMVLRVLRLVKIIGNVKRFQVIIGTLMQIGPAISIYGTMIFILYYMYAIVGMELFAGSINMHGYPSKDAGNYSILWNVTNLFCGDVKLKDSDFHLDRYCNNNFNDVLKSFKLLFDLTVVNQWHVITQGFVLITNQFARIYFMSFHLVCVIVVLNIFVAFILEAFMLEYSFTHGGKFEAAFEKKIAEKGVGVGDSPIKFRAESITRPLDKDFFLEDKPEYESDHSSTLKSTLSVEEFALDLGLRFCLPKQQKKNAESLLQQMFESELKEDDLGPKGMEDLDDLDDIAEEQELRRDKRLSFETAG